MSSQFPPSTLVSSPVNLTNPPKSGPTSPMISSNILGDPGTAFNSAAGVGAIGSGGFNAGNTFGSGSAFDKFPSTGLGQVAGSNSPPLIYNAGVQGDWLNPNLPSPQPSYRMSPADHHGGGVGGSQMGNSPAYRNNPSPPVLLHHSQLPPIEKFRSSGRHGLDDDDDDDDDERGMMRNIMSNDGGRNSAAGSLYSGGGGDGGGVGEGRRYYANRNRAAAAAAADGEKSGNFEQITGMGLGISSLFSEHILSHPFIVLRRQCQVHRDSGPTLHTTPFSLFPVIFNLQQEQGVGSLWKGVSSSLGIQGMIYGSTYVLGQLTGFPRTLTPRSTKHHVFQHFALRAMSYAVVTPFSMSAFLQTVQSSLASESASPLDCVRDAVERIRKDLPLIGMRDASRRIAIWTLIPPSVSYRLCHYVLHGMTHHVAHAVVRRHMDKKSLYRSTFDDFVPDLFASLCSYMVADSILYPLETVLHRLYLQGTRSIIDNLETGASVMPISSSYEGFTDCVRSIFRSEGVLGFYKGFGALISQYILHYAILRVTRLIIEYVEEILRDRPPTRQPSRPHSALQQPKQF